jgi:hypothetical protein
MIMFSNSDAGTTGTTSTSIPTPLRLLPWTTPEGKPCYLAGNGTGRISRLADEMEHTQLSMATDLLGHAADLLAPATEVTAHQVTPAQLHFLASRLAEALRDVHRIAESRGARHS